MGIIALILSITALLWLWATHSWVQKIAQLNVKVLQLFEYSAVIEIYLDIKAMVHHILKHASEELLSGLSKEDLEDADIWLSSITVNGNTHQELELRRTIFNKRDFYINGIKSTCFPFLEVNTGIKIKHSYIRIPEDWTIPIDISFDGSDLWIKPKLSIFEKDLEFFRLPLLKIIYDLEKHFYKNQNLENNTVIDGLKKEYPELDMEVNYTDSHDTSFQFRNKFCFIKTDVSFYSATDWKILS